MWIGYRRRRGLSIACLLVGAQACSSATGVPTETEGPAAWEALEPLPVAVRSAAVATDGARVYVVGGSAESGRTTLLQILDLEAESWSYGASLPEPTDWGTAAWVAGTLHFIGGVTDAASASAQHYAYDPGSNEWSVRPSVPQAIAGTSGLTDGSDIYVFAGNSGGSPAYTSKTYVYDVAGGSWTPGLDVPGARINWSGTFHEGLFYLIGGQTSGVETSSDLLEYDPVADSWTTLRPIPVEREAHGVASANGLVCAIGGRLAAGGNFNTPYDDVSCYDPATDRWEPAPPLPRARQELAAVTVGDLMIAIGGADEESQPVSDVTAIRLR